MQFELKQLQRELGITIVFVTHDQEEALAMSDRIAVMNAGRVEQIGTPREIYDRPATRFVADFIGDTNLFRGRGDRRRLGAIPSVSQSATAWCSRCPKLPRRRSAGAVSVALRPEKISLAGRSQSPITAGTSANGIVESTNFLGGSVLYRIMSPAAAACSSSNHNAGAEPVSWPGRRSRSLDTIRHRHSQG